MTALTTGMWAAGSALLFTSLFSGMAGVGPGLSTAFADGGGFDVPDVPEVPEAPEVPEVDAGGDDGGGFFDGLFGGGDGDGGGLFDFGGDGGDGGLFDF